MSLPTFNRGKSQRPPTMPKPVTFPRGPKWEQKLRKNATTITGPGQPPPGFVRGTTSSVEWVVYWALFKILAPTRDPRQAPFWGLDGVFRYQKAFNNGRERGGSVLDCHHEYGPKIRTRVGIRLQTTRFHEQAPAQQIMMDRMRRQWLSAQMTVIDLWDYEILEDNGTPGNGAKAIVGVKQAVGMIETTSRLALGNAREVRYKAWR
jgi:hypothetical protein